MEIFIVFIIMVVIVFILGVHFAFSKKQKVKNEEEELKIKKLNDMLIIREKKEKELEIIREKKEKELEIIREKKEKELERKQNRLKIDKEKKRENFENYGIESITILLNNIDVKNSQIKLKEKIDSEFGYLGIEFFEDNLKNRREKIKVEIEKNNFLNNFNIEKQQKPSYVYFLKAGDSFKIGKANNIEERIKTLQTGNPAKIETIGSKKFNSEEDAFSFETVLQGIFLENNIRGEWYDLNENEVKQILILLK